MRKTLALCALSVLAISAANAAQASVIANNPFDPAGGGFQATTYPNQFDLNPYVAESFSIKYQTTIQTLSVTEDESLAAGTSVTGVNWFILDDLSDGPFSYGFGGESGILSSKLVLTDTAQNLSFFTDTFSIQGFPLAAGNYYFAVKLITNKANVLVDGALSDAPGAYNFDPGAFPFGESEVPWSQYIPVAVSLDGQTVPEPATWAMMLVGFVGLGIALRARPATSLYIRRP